MKLKKIEVVGFKSFADREVIHVDEHVTGVIGPNGCGKSNIVDAVRWCMGEQSAKHLRGAGMSDVIFAGCATRGPAGMAEVVLTLVNQGDAPPPYSEYGDIAIARRLYRDGTSEYLINKVPVRLRDVVDLLMGTGAGTKGYAIIEQGQVGRVVSSKPEERRHIIDEAAGITRFKAQKLAAERKIDATRLNLLRVQDVTGELEGRLGTLHRQAQKAERYKRYKSELRDLELWMGSHRWLELDATGRVLEGRRLDVGQQVDDLRQTLAARETEIQAKRLALLEVERVLSERQQAQYGLDNRIALLEQENDYRKRERERAVEAASQARTEREVVQRALEGLEQELEQVQAQQAELASGDATSATVEMLEREHAELSAAIANTQSELQRERSRVTELRSTQATTDARLQAAKESSGELERRAQSLVDELAEVALQVERDRESSAVTETAATAAIEAVERLRARRGELERDRVSLKQSVQSSQVEMDTQRAEVQRCRSRLQTLEEIQSRYRRCASGVQVVMEHREELGAVELGAGAGAQANRSVLGIMADYISAPAHLEAAVSAVLGDRLEGVVVSEPASAAWGVELLKRKEEGRIPFLPRACRTPTDVVSSATKTLGWAQPGPYRADKIEVVDASSHGAVEGSALVDPAREFDAVPGVLGRLADLVDIDPQMRGLGNALIGNAVVVDGLSRALELWETHRANATLVTLDGDRVEPTGVVVGGSPTALDSALLQQKREIRDLQDILRQLEESFAEIRGRHLALAEQLAAIESERDANETQMLQAEQVRVEHVKALEHQKQALSRLQARANELQRGRDDIARQQAARNEEAQRLEHTRRECEEHLPPALARVEALEQRQLETEASREQLASTLTDAKVEFARWQQRRDALTSASERLRRQMSSERDRVRRLDGTIEQAALKQTEIDRATEVAGVEREQLLDHSKQASSLVHDAREQFEALRVATDDLDVVARNLRTDLEAQRERLGQLDIGLREIELEREHLERDVAERFDLGLREVVTDHHNRPLAGEVERERQKELKQILSRMGEVNLTAIEEYEEVSTRYEYLTAQRADLEQAIGQLQEAIDTINKTTRQRFQETFDLVNERFQHVFPRLFNGGRAELRMTDPDDLLNTGIEIAAQPPGKQLRSLDLLSGGEKALTATSLIFAIFLIKPSPFCLLDEVDAPLDDANVVRVCNLVRELSDRTQFIIITHNKVTMETADRLYGVTMEQRGVSKLVSVNMRRAVELAYN